MNKQELQDWGQRLDAGMTSDPSLEIAEELQSRYTSASQTPAGFRKSLKSRLLAQAQNRPSLAWQRLGATLPGSLVVILLLSIITILQQPQAVSAAEILERTNENFLSQTQGGGALHRRFSLVTDGALKLNAVAEMWQSLDSEDFRYQLSDQDGNLLYFVQRDGDRIWRSVHQQPVGSAVIDSVYSLSEEQYKLLIAPEEESSSLRLPPIFGDLIKWLELDRWLTSQGQNCDELFCLLGLSNIPSWDCDEDICRLLLLGAELELPPVYLEASVAGTEELEGGHSAIVIEFRTSHDNALIRSLKFDAETYELLEVVGYSFEEENARMTLQSQSVSTEYKDVKALPVGIRLEQWTEPSPPPDATIGGTPLFHPPEGSFVSSFPVIVLFSPRTGSTVSGTFDIGLTILPNFGVQDEAELIVQLCAYSPDDPGSFARGVDCVGLPQRQVRVRSDQPNVRIEFTAQVDETWPNIVTILLELHYDDGRLIYGLNSDHFWVVDR